jgi:para-aminobenzoate synthetase
MSTLLIDNYDSYTYNVFHLLAAVSGEEPIVVHNDMVSWRVLSRWDFDAIVLSPGPGRPERWHDFGVCADILRSSEIPVLGVCLGHQGLGHVLGAPVTTAPVAMHGRLSRVRHHGSGLFAGIPQNFSVVRYHSLAVAGELGPAGRITAWTDDGVVMGIEHSHRPLWGVQFHPESIATEHGHRLIENFYALARRHRPASSRRRSRAIPAKRGLPEQPRSGRSAPESEPQRSAPESEPQRPAPESDSQRSAPGFARANPSAAALRLSVRSLPGVPCAELLFERLFGDAKYAFWLDSADAPSPLAQWSYLGTSAGPERCVIEYDVTEGVVKMHAAAGSTVEHASIFEVLDRELARDAIDPAQWPAAQAGSTPSLLGGFVGYLGYECKADCGSPNVHRSDVPDALFMFANRILAIDHVNQRTHILALGRPGDPAVEGWSSWVCASIDQARTIRQTIGVPPGPGPSRRPSHPSPPVRKPAYEPSERAVVFNCGRGREQYLADIARSQAALLAGESYEVCLTDQISTAATPEPFALYRTLRASNPAPFAAYLKLGDVAVLSSSPERFLAVDRHRRVHARPIKGTAPRGSDPVRDGQLREELTHEEKTFAEHLMIVDLLRNDLGRVCAIDSVRVPELMVVESYATVHQLVSTVSGVLEDGRTPVDCVRACFPGGSMTGAPKLRTMSIIDDIERVARGVYSGALGYFALDGSVDLSIVIRTILMRPGLATIGAGGAIVMQSDAQHEFDELLLKARAPMAAIARAVTGSDAPEAWTLNIEPPVKPAAAIAGAA